MAVRRETPRLLDRGRGLRRPSRPEVEESRRRGTRERGTRGQGRGFGGERPIYRYTMLYLFHFNLDLNKTTNLSHFNV